VKDMREYLWGRKDSRNVTLIELGPRERAGDNKQASQPQGLNHLMLKHQTCERVMINVLKETYQSWESGARI
jgi:hypothetical protein